MNIKRFISSLLAGAILALSCENPVPDPVPQPVPENPDEKQEPDTPDPEPEYDGLVKQLLAATSGSGLDIVLMGDGFVEADHESGAYDEVMATALKYLFSVEPLTSLKSYFNVYSVGVVSADSKLDGKSGLKCKGVYPTDASPMAVDSYARKVEGLKVSNTVMCIIINSREFGGWTEYESYSMQKAYAYCPMIRQSKPGSEDFRLALVHETFGHGFAKMMDEYVMSGYEGASPTAQNKADHRSHQKYGYDLNVSMTNDPAACPWADFIGDERYADENIGFYEGVGYYGKNAWRATSQSLMNVTVGKNVQFSAPDRRIIYDLVMKRGEGRTPTYEEFVEFDKKQ